ncbi:MAG: hypothetical protein HVN35_00730 [Methanobacteriaceae archaeon]|nr:hypothetical protein [Methanobacteriaceae archaeon]
MNPTPKIQKLKEALKGRECTVEEHSSVMEVTFEDSKDADWFESIFEYYQSKSAVSCLMSMRPKGANARHKFVFNVRDMDKFIELIKE